MHENREISWTSWSKDQDRSAKVINRTADVHVQEKSDCAIVPMNQPNNEDLSSTEVGAGRAWTKEKHRSIWHVPDTVREFACPTDCAMCGEDLLPPLSKVRAVCGSTACTDLRGGRRVIGVPTATVRFVLANSLFLIAHFHNVIIGGVLFGAMA